MSDYTAPSERIENLIMEYQNPRALPWAML
jgi:hypothetical protein